MHTAKRTLLAAGLCALLLFGGCGNKTRQIGNETAMEMADFNVYCDGQVAVALDTVDEGMFLFAWAEEYELDLRDVCTRRGVHLNDSDYEIVKQYGGIQCQVDVYEDGQWETIYDTTFLDYYGSTAYKKEYTVTFYAFLQNGRLQSARGEEEFVSVNIASPKINEIWGLTFTVQGGVIRDIESFTFET